MTRTTPSRWLSFQIGCTYIGTVVGAGFASGQEIYQFFGRYGNHGYIAVLISIFLFAWIGYKVMLLGHRLQAKSFQEANRYLFGSVIGRIVNWVLVFMLFGITVAMLAGAGELLHEQLNMPFQLGVLATIIATYITITRGMGGILGANSLIVPVMVGFVVFSGLHALSLHGFDAFLTGRYFGNRDPVMPLISSIIYVSFNVGLASGVLIPLGGEVADMTTLRRGAVSGAIGLGLMLATVLFVLFSHYPRVMEFEVPMGYVASLMGTFVQMMFIIVLWGEIYSTLVGNVYALTAQVPFGHQRGAHVFTIAILLAAFAASHMGFSTIVKHVYPVFGWVSVLFILGLLWPRRGLRF